MFAVFVKSWKMNLPISTLTCLRSIAQVSTFNASCHTVLQFSDLKKTIRCTGAFVQTPAKAAEDFGSTWRNTSCLEPQKPQLWRWNGETWDILIQRLMVWLMVLVDGLEKSLVWKKCQLCGRQQHGTFLEVYDTYLTYLIFLLGWLFCVGKGWCMRS